MTTPKNLRAIDQVAFAPKKTRTDFIIRRHSLSTHQLYKLFLMTLIIAAATTYIVYNDKILGSVACTTIGLVLFVIATQVERYKNILATTEFLNALFSSALGANHKFCMIVNKQDNSIVYLNNSFQKAFPDMLPLSERNLPTLLEMYKAPANKRKNIMDAIKSKNPTSVSLKMESGKDHKTQSMTFNIEPIQRPAGFCLVRGE